MNTRSRVVLAVSVGCLFLFAYSSFVPRLPSDDLNANQHEQDTTAFLDDYGYDRLSDAAEEEWLNAFDDEPTTSNPGFDHLLDTISFAEWEYYSNTGQVVQNPGHLLPFSAQQEIHLLRSAAEDFSVFRTGLEEMTPSREFVWESTLPDLPLLCREQIPLVVLLDDKSMPQWQSQIPGLLQFSRDQAVAVVYFGADLPAVLLDQPFSLLHLPDQRETAQAMAVQMLFGGQDTYYAQKGWLAATRLGHAPPEAVGVDRSKLQRIDRYVERAIRRKAIPGCQVLVAKSGKIIYDKSFGYFTYDKEQRVNHQSIYDLASLTKAAATTLGVMDLYEAGEVDLAARIKDYLPQYQKYGLKHLRIRHLLAHQTGLQANLPIAHWLRQKDVFQSEASADYPLAISSDFYLRNNVRETLLEEMKKVRTARRPFFRYSDVNFILLQQVIEETSGMALDDYLRLNFYDPMGLRRLRYRAGLVFPKSEIVPTEHDKRWRAEVVQGVVHDESAVLMGGVAGHAGLFGNARDLAGLFQMFLQDGTYGGRQYLEAKTIEQFIRRNGYNYRAFGFDRLAGHSKSLKYYGASNDTFGHTGFTGTCVWADPEEDLIFIFLSNRIHPYKYNNKLQKLGLRERIHKIVYQCLGSFQEEEV